MCNSSSDDGARSARTLYVDALDTLLRGEMGRVAIERDWALLGEVARLATSDAPLALARTDPALFETWRAAVTNYHLAGWTAVTPDRVARIARQCEDEAARRAALAAEG